LLFTQKFISQAAMDRAAADYKAAQAQVAATIASAGQAATTKGFAVVVAPYSGVVAARHVEIGEMASPGKPLMTGFDPNGLRVVANVPQYKLGAITSNTKATAEIPALGKWVNASAVTVLPISDPHTLTTKARLDLPADVKGVFPGMFARAHFVVGRATKLVVPAEALVQRSEVTAVYVIPETGSAQLRQVRLGVAAGKDGVEVLAGLRPGERVSLEPIKTGMALKQTVK
jgi:RND family efflux transporter MFP subunit